MEQGANWPSFEALAAQLQRWEREHPRLLSLETLCPSARGRPVFMAQLTDPDADDAAKEHCLVTCLHSGIERSGTSSVFELMAWLLSADPVARETLRRQVVVAMPLINPDGYVLGTHVNTTGGDPYTGWTLEGPRDPEHSPENVAVQQVAERYQPEVHADVHGLDLSFPGYMSLESSGAAYSNLSLRPYHLRVAQLMDEAALAAGYPSDEGEQDAERLFWGPELDSISDRLWTGRARCYGAVYCYHRYHTLVLAAEAMWSPSGMARCRRLLEIGNGLWPGECYPGYPCRVVGWNILHLVTAYGTDAAQRRRSRVELWTKQGQLAHGMVNPQVEGVAIHVCATSPAAVTRWCGDLTVAGFLAGIAEHPGIDRAPIARLLAGLPEGRGQWGETPNLYLTGPTVEQRAAEPIAHGIALRLRIPYPRARLRDIRLNGHPLAPSATDGYQTWQARGYVYVQVNVPPARSVSADLLIATCEYDPGEQRRQVWWPDPAE